MKKQFIKQGRSDTLLLIFTGWASDERFFHPSPDTNEDICLCSDYRTLEWDDAPFRSYREVRVMAWSLGVFAANSVLRHSTLPIVQAVAVNGTIYPAHNERGIPVAVYEGTEKMLTERNLLKFYRRMCGSEALYEEVKQYTPTLSISELQEALRTIRAAQENRSPDGEKTIFTKVIIGLSDRIFPTENQQRAWDGHPNVTFKNIAHYDREIWKR